MTTPEREKLSPRAAAACAALARSARSGVWFCLALGVLGIGGGLPLAFVDFDAGEPLARVGPVQPEILYVRPGAEMVPSEERLATATPTLKVTEEMSAGAAATELPELPPQILLDASVALANLGPRLGPTGEFSTSGETEHPKFASTSLNSALATMTDVAPSDRQCTVMPAWKSPRCRSPRRGPPWHSERCWRAALSEDIAAGRAPLPLWAPDSVQARRRFMRRSRFSPYAPVSIRRPPETGPA